MKPRMFLMILCLACLVAFPASAVEDKPCGSANYLVKIEFDPNVLPLDLQLANRLLGTSPIWAQAVKDAGLPSVPHAPGLVDVDAPARPADAPVPPSATGAPRPAGGRTRYRGPAVAPTRRPIAPGSSRQPWANVLLGELVIRSHPGGSDADAERLAAAVCKRFEKVLLDAHGKWLAQVDHRRAALKDRLGPAEKTVAALRAEQQELLKKVAVSLLSHKDALAAGSMLAASMNQIADWARDRQRLEMELSTAVAEIAAHEEQIARIGKLVTERVKKDELLAEYGKIVTARQQEVDRLQEILRKDDETTEREVGSARRLLAQAKVDLLKRRAEVAASAGGDQLAGMNKDLTSLALGKASLRACLLAAQANLQDYRQRDVLGLSARHDRLSGEITRAERTPAELRAELDGLDRQIRALRRPAVTIIGETPEAKPKKK